MKLISRNEISIIHKTFALIKSSVLTTICDRDKISSRVI